MRNRGHNRRGVGRRRVKTPLLAPVYEFVESVVMKLTRQARKLSIAFSCWPMTSCARRYVGIRYAFLVVVFSVGCEPAYSGIQGLGIEFAEIFCQRRPHSRGQGM